MGDFPCLPKEQKSAHPLPLTIDEGAPDSFPAPPWIGSEGGAALPGVPHESSAAAEQQIDEVRFEEDLEPLGLSWIKLGLQDVLYDPKTRTVYTLNTNQSARMGGSLMPGETDKGEETAPPAPAEGEKPLQERAGGAIVEERENPYHDEQGRFTSAGGLTGNAEAGNPSGSLLEPDNLAAYMEPQSTKYSKSPQRSKKGLQVSTSTYVGLCSSMMSRDPFNKEGNQYVLHSGSKSYLVTADGYGGLVVNKVFSKKKRR